MYLSLLNIIHSMCSHFQTNNSNLFLFIAPLHSFVYKYHLYFISSFANGSISSFQELAIMSYDFVGTGLRVSLLYDIYDYFRRIHPIAAWNGWPNLVLGFRVISILISLAIAIVYTPNCRIVLLPTALPAFLLDFLMIVICSWVKWNFIAVIIVIPQDFFC